MRPSVFVSLLPAHSQASPLCSGQRERWTGFASLISRSAKHKSPQCFFQQTSVLSYDRSQVSPPFLAKMFRDSLHSHDEKDCWILSNVYSGCTTCQPRACLLASLEDAWKLSSVWGSVKALLLWFPVVEWRVADGDPTEVKAGEWIIHGHASGSGRTMGVLSGRFEMSFWGQSKSTGYMTKLITRWPKICVQFSYSKAKLQNQQFQVQISDFLFITLTPWWTSLLIHFT